MTDIPAQNTSVAGRLGVSARISGGELSLELEPRPEVLHHGFVRASVLAFVIDVVGGVAVDDDPDAWTLTSDMSVRMRLAPPPPRIEAVGRVVRRGRRSATCAVDLTDRAGMPVATGAIGFAKIPRRPGDPPKPEFSPGSALSIFRDIGGLNRPLRDEAGIVVIDAASGVLELSVTPELRNPAGTLQGAMVALLAEAAAEDFLSTLAGLPMVVCDLDLRYLAQAPTGPVRTWTRLLGEGPDAPVEIELVDISADRVTTLVYARALPIPAGPR
jgi:acyl-coenzyme A thioesterase PaaI-like protein